MEGMVESAPESLKRHDFGLLNNETKEKLVKFYPPGPGRIFDRREIEMLCCARISVMFKAIEVLIDITMKALAERDFQLFKKNSLQKNAQNWHSQFAQLKKHAK
uniref:Uncharacterized protein n=1 Tax=Panagrolaimus davidi TaxID=227884 RepID=A0A914QTP5_9BILA